MKTHWIIVIVSLGLFYVSEAERIVCTSKRWCEDCITAHSDCAWCKDKEFSETRCDLVSELKGKCTDIFSPNNTEIKQENRPLEDGSTNKDPVQVQPQKLKVTVRPGRVQYINMTYRIAQNLPIDMYFVLDFTMTMRHKLNDLADLTETLIQNLKKSFTNNIYIGFGSFLDKPIQPFYVTTPEMYENPCSQQGRTCAKSYGFIHHKKLNDNIQQFIEAVRNGNTSSNFDPMEGGLDAMLQAAVCPDIVGWRQQSRRVLIYISDGGFHFAGDGKLAGIDRPNDGRCHMERHTNAGEYIYTHSTIHDYPSYGGLRKALDDNKINTFFLVRSNEEMLYRGLSGVLKQAETATMDTAGAADIVQHITNYYTSLSQKIEIFGEDIPDELDVKISSYCINNRVATTWDLKKANAICTSLTTGTPVLFNLSVNLLECPSNRSDRFRTFKILPAGLQESLEIDVEFTCDCECPTSEELDREKCSGGNGTYECGVCRCKPGRSGEFCQCDKTSSTNINEDNCKRFNESNVICENQGTCKCGQCVCLANFEGKWCECDSSKCIMKGTSIKCGGPEQGDCGCEKCTCKGGHYGEYCQCRPRSHCLAENGVECSGNGRCECGQCVCDTNYEGETCEKCPKCDRCRPCGYRSCVQCLLKEGLVRANYTGPLCRTECATLEVTPVDIFEKGETDNKPCGFIDSDQCEINYRVKCEQDTIFLLIAKGKLCTQPPNPLLIAMPVLGGILGVGILLLLIWKILTLFYDKIEYARFEHEIQNAKWTKVDNPIYKTPVTSNQNPVYKGTVD